MPQDATTIHHWPQVAVNSHHWLLLRGATRAGPSHYRTPYLWAINGSIPNHPEEPMTPARPVVLSELHPVQDLHSWSCHNSIGTKPADDPLSSHTMRAPVWSLEEPLRQCREATEGAYGAIKKESTGMLSSQVPCGFSGIRHERVW